MGLNCLLFTALLYVVVTLAAAEEDKCNGPNEERKCLKDCPPPRTCANRNIAFRCADDPKKCKTKCVCKTGFYRQSYDGSCITKKQCDMCSGPNEFYSCGSACDNECSKLGKQSRENCPIVNIQCNKRCYCQNGYARNAKNKCVPESQCRRSGRDRRDVSTSRRPVCGKNEVYVANFKPCPPDTCLSMVAKFNCAANPKRGQPGCRCKHGTLRLQKGHPCMPIAHCPQMANRTNSPVVPFAVPTY